ncbi:hypothetical protein MMC14_002791 [Varicellaria rhodocarpa]|nr:hypothetical protein [Varicellaria rhodocarpa]
MDEKTSFFGYIDEQLFKTPQFHRILELSGEGSYASSPNGINTAPYTHSQECPAEGSFFPIASSANGVKAGLYTHPEGLPREESCFPIASSANVIKAGFYSNPAAPYDPDFERIMMFRDATSDRHHAAVDPVEDGENNFETPDSRPVLNRIQYSANIMVSQSPQHGSPRFRLPLPSWEGHNPMSAAFPSRSFQTDYGPNGLPPYDVSQHWDDPSTNIYLAKDQDQIKESSPDTTYQPPTPGHSCHQDCYSSIETALASMATSSSGLAEPPACLPPSLRTTAAASLPPSRKAPPKPSPVLRSNTVNTTYHHIQ